MAGPPIVVPFNPNAIIPAKNVQPPNNYGGMNGIEDPRVRAALKLIFDRIGHVEGHVEFLRTQASSLLSATSGYGKTIPSVANPVKQTDAANLQTVHSVATATLAKAVVVLKDGSVLPVLAAPPIKRQVFGGSTGSPPTEGGPVGPPTPPPSNPPPGGGGPPATGLIGVTDAINLNTVVVENSPPDIASWTLTTILSQISWSGVASDPTIGGVAPTFSAQSTWPDYTPPGWTGPLQYTLWLFLNIGDTWYGSGIIQFWRGLTANGGGPLNVGPNWVYDPVRWGPMAGHQPAVGELIGMMVSAGNARGQFTVTSVKERSQVVTFPFPPATGGVFHN